MAVKIKIIHKISFSIGLAFLALSLVQAIFYSYPNFYTSFAFGSWLVLDYLDWKLNHASILGYFFNHKHRHAFILLFIASTIFCFVIDYVYGVRLAKMWEWVGYGPVEYVRMYLFMNLSYVLGMYELFRIVRSYLAAFIPAVHLVKFRVVHESQRHVFNVMVSVGLLCLMSPLYVLITGSDYLVEYVMLLPFVGMFLVSDGLTGLLGGVSLLFELARLNRLQVFSLLLTVVLAAGATEVVNLFGGEWKYLKMPFESVTLLNVPVAVFLGWIPLVVGAISVINLTRQAELFYEKTR